MGTELRGVQWIDPCSKVLRDRFFFSVQEEAGWRALFREVYTDFEGRETWREEWEVAARENIGEVVISGIERWVCLQNIDISYRL